MGEWKSKGPHTDQSPITQYILRIGRQSVQVAHYIINERPACVQLVMKDGKTLRLAPFKCTWTALNDRDKKCVYCITLEEVLNVFPDAQCVTTKDSA